MEKAYEAAYSYKRMVRISDYGDMIEQLPVGLPNLPKPVFVDEDGKPVFNEEEPSEPPGRDSKNPLESKTQHLIKKPFRIKGLHAKKSVDKTCWMWYYKT